MKKLIFITAFTALVCAVLLSCKKNKDEDSRMKLMTERTWRLTMYEYRENTTDPWDVEVLTDPCELDNIFSFLSAGTYTVTEGPTKCDPSDPDLIDSGTWSFQNNETIFRITQFGVDVDGTIDVLDANTLKFTIYDPSGPEYIRITMVH